MCGRIKPARFEDLAREWSDEKRYGYEPFSQLKLDLAPELFPDSTIGAFIERGDKLELTPAGWGFKRSFQGSAPKAVFNARWEHSNGSFRSRMWEPALNKGRRCVVPAAGFWEWPMLSGKKTRILIDRADGRPMAFAGLWEEAEDGLHVTVITTDPSPWFEEHELHDRMPAILDNDKLDAWLHADGDDVALLLSPWRGKLKAEPNEPEKKPKAKKAKTATPRKRNQ